MEKIIRIEGATFKKSKDDYCSYEGFEVVTDKQTIKLGIENGQSCCENWGYFMSEDNLSEFVGAKLKSVSIADTQLKPSKEFDATEMYEGDVMFVNIETDNGLLQFVAYNEHNGYYGHHACVVSTQLNESFCL